MSHSTIFQLYMWRHIDVQADWRRSWNICLCLSTPCSVLDVGCKSISKTLTSVTDKKVYDTNAISSQIIFNNDKVTIIIKLSLICRREENVTPLTSSLQQIALHGFCHSWHYSHRAVCSRGWQSFYHTAPQPYWGHLMAPARWLSDTRPFLWYLSASRHGPLPQSLYQTGSWSKM